MARAGSWVRDELHGDDPEEPNPQLEFFKLFDEEPGGSRPDRLAGVRPQERAQRHTAEQFDDIAPDVPSLDVTVPLMVEQLVDVFRSFDTLLPVAEQAIDVPRIIFEDIPSRTPLREPQLTEQLVEVPTILHFLKETVDIPVPRGRGRRLQGFLPEQRSSASSGGL